MTKILFTTFILLLLCLSAYAQKKTINPQLTAKKVLEKIKMDGKLDDPAWAAAEETTGFIQNFPTDSLLAKEQVFVKVAFDEQHLHFAIRVEYVGKLPFTISSLRRDFEPSSNNSVAILLDPFSDGLNGFAFLVSPMGVEAEAVISDGDRNNFTWDNKWQSIVQRHENYWTAEIAIPLKTIRYPKNKAAWRANFINYNTSKNEISSWKPIPQNFALLNMAFSGDLLFDNNLPSPGMNVSFIPFATSKGSKRHLDNTPSKWTADAGFDAKVAITPALNLDLTANPDFSQVEVDRQVTNLDRFELFFPERRQFFIENSDLFSNIGFSRVRPFFSRRIGIGYDTITKQIVQNPIIYGARLSGKVAPKTRIGLLNMQTARDESAGIAGQNYTVAVAQQQILSRSSVSAILVNREKFGGSASDPDKFTRLFGLDYVMQSADNKWTGKLFHHRALKPEQQNDAYTHAGWLMRRTRNVNAAINYEYVGANYDINDIGYVARNGHWRWEWWFGYNFYPKKSKTLFRHGFNIYHNTYQNQQFFTTDQNAELSYRFEFINTSNAGAGLYFDEVFLYFPFDPTNSGGEKLKAGNRYINNGAYIYYNSDRRKNFTFSGDYNYQNYYGGSLTSSSLSLGYRFQPYGSANLSVNYNNISLPSPYKSATFWLIGPRVDISFTKKVFFSTFMQYNKQANNVNLNARLQWRFAPVSDLFLVYTDNYFPEDFKAKSRALVLKLSYWLNI